MIASPARGNAATAPTAYGEEHEAIKDPLEGAEQPSGSLSENIDRTYYQARQDQQQKWLEQHRAIMDHHHMLMEHHRTVQALFQRLQDGQHYMQAQQQDWENYHREVQIHHHMLEQHHQMLEQHYRMFEGKKENHSSHQELESP